MNETEIDAAFERYFARRPEVLDQAIRRHFAKFPPPAGKPGRDGRDGRDAVTASPPVIHVHTARGERTVITKHDKQGRILEFERWPIETEDE